MTGDIERLLTELSRANVRYLVVGGVAVVLHGYLRATADLDLVIDLEAGNLDRAIEVFTRMGFRPRAPVALQDFRNAAERRRWIDEKNMTVLSLWHPEMHGFEVDLFVQVPFDFDDVYGRAVAARIGDTDVTTLGIDDLIEMKRRVGRGLDAEDIRALQQLKDRK